MMIYFRLKTQIGENTEVYPSGFNLNKDNENCLKCSFMDLDVYISQCEI